MCHDPLHEAAQLEALADLDQLARQMQLDVIAGHELGPTYIEFRRVLQYVTESHGHHWTDVLDVAHSQASRTGTGGSML